MRNGYNYRTIDFEDIQQVRLKKGRSIKNWILLLFLGVAMTGFGLYYAFHLFVFLTSGEGGHMYIEQLLIPLFPLLLGSFSLYKSLMTEKVLEFKLRNGKESFSTKDLEASGKLPDMLYFLSSRTQVIGY